MAETSNYHLHLTDSDSEYFLDWREAMNGTDNSNMIKIDTALGEKANESVPVSAILAANGWVTQNGVCTQTISVAGLGATQNGNIGLAVTATAEQREAARSADLIVSAQAAGALTIAADGVCPTVDIPVTIILLG